MLHFLQAGPEPPRPGYGFTDLDLLEGLWVYLPFLLIAIIILLILLLIKRKK